MPRLYAVESLRAKAQVVKRHIPGSLFPSSQKPGYVSLSLLGHHPPVLGPVSGFKLEVNCYDDKDNTE